MSVNYRVSEQVNKLGELYAKNKEEFLQEKEVYFRILEEELMKQPLNGWIDWEDPIDCLMESIDCEEDPKIVEDILHDYMRFCGIVARCRNQKIEDVTNQKVIYKAMNYCYCFDVR